VDKRDELKHFGILNMKWGVRRYQNPDGSLTPEGRIRYGVGMAQNPSNVGNHMSDEELRNMTKRYKNESSFYKARNEYLMAQEQYKRLTTPQKKTSQFLNKVFIQPLENVMAKNVEFGFMSLGASFVDATDSKYTDEYMRWIFNNKDNKKNKNHNNNYNNNYNNNNFNNRNNQNRNRDDDDDDDDDDDE